jgi:hypothetical protein
MAPASHPCNEVGELPNLCLAQPTSVQRVVEHDHEQLNRTAGSVDGGEARFSHAVAFVASERMTLVLSDRPA